MDYDAYKTAGDAPYCHHPYVYYRVDYSKGEHWPYPIYDNNQHPDGL